MLLHFSWVIGESISVGTADIFLVSGGSKEYISLIEGTAPPCVFQAFAHPTSPCSVCSILQLPDCLTEQGVEVGWPNVWKTQGGAVPSITDICIMYILWVDLSFYAVTVFLVSDETISIYNSLVNIFLGNGGLLQ